MELSDVAAPVSHGHQLAKLDLGGIVSLVCCGSVEVLTSQIKLPHRPHVMIHMPVSGYQDSGSNFRLHYSSFKNTYQPIFKLSATLVAVSLLSIYS